MSGLERIGRLKKNHFENRKILLGISGSIAAYKACELIRLLVKEKAQVVVALTPHAREFITSLTLKTLSGHSVLESLYDEIEFTNIMHIDIAHWAEVIIIAPATANVISKVACGIADDLITTTILAAKAPVIFAPAMNDQMYENSIFQENLKKLQKHGYHLVKPETGSLACGYEGVGRLACADSILEAIGQQLQKNK